MAKREIRPIRVDGQVAYVPLTKGYTAIIDAEDVPLVAGFNWHSTVALRADGSLRAVYATRRELGKAIYLHRALLQLSAGAEVDHIDGNGLNNRRTNLRPATKAQNQHNQRVKANNTSGHKGVTWHRRAAKWQASIRKDGVTKHLGTFASIDDASAAYASASHAMHAEYGRVA